MDCPPAQQPTKPQLVHIHQAPPDRTVHRMVLGVEVVATGVHCGPLLAGVLTASAANLAVLAFLATGMAWTWSPSSAP